MESSEHAHGKPSYDQALKWMLAQAPDGLLALIWPGLTWRRELSPELPAVGRQADLVWEIADPAGERGVLHIELQTKPESDIGERVAEYGLRLWLREHVPVRSVVIFLRPARTVPASPFVIHFLGHESLRYSYEVIRLWELPQERVLGTPQYALWPLASVMANVSPETTLDVAERLAGVGASRQERSDLIGLLAALAGLRLPQAAVLTALRRNPMIDDLLNESSVADAFIEEGERRMARRMALAALGGRFGPLSEEVIAAIGTADEATLQEIVAQVATETLEQVRTRLGM